jgi:hypothetical protein
MIFRELANATTFVWVDFSGTGGNPDFELSKGERFFFEVFETGSTSGFESQYINITDSETSSVAPTTTTGSAPVSTTPPTSTSSALSISSILASFTLASASPTSNASAGGLSSGDKTRVGVGVSLGVVAIVVGLGVGFFFYRRKKAADAHRYAPPQTEIEPATQQPTELPEETPKPDYGTWKPASSFYINAALASLLGLMLAHPQRRLKQQLFNSRDGNAKWHENIPIPKYPSLYNEG